MGDSIRMGYGSGSGNNSIDGEPKKYWEDITNVRRFIYDNTSLFQKREQKYHEKNIDNSETETSIYKKFEFESGAEILIKCTAQYGRGFICSLVFDKTLKNLEEIEKFREADAFKNIFYSDYPFMIKEFNDEMQLHFILGNPHFELALNKQNCKFRKLKKAFKKLINPQETQRKKQHKNYINCQIKMANTSYTDLMDCDKIFAPIKETENIK